MVSSSRNQTICYINVHFIEKKIKCICLDFFIIYKKNRLPYFSFSNSSRDFLHQTFAHISTNIKLCISSNLNHMSRYALIIKQTENIVKIQTDYIIKHYDILLSFFFWKNNKTVYSRRNF